MKLTGKCKEDFEKWVENPLREQVALRRRKEWFYTLTPSMKYGVFEDFFDSVKIDIDGIYDNEIYILDNMYQDGENHRTEARIRAIEKANEIYNNYENRSKRFKNR